jgi:hypothetical protein
MSERQSFAELLEAGQAAKIAPPPVLVPITGLPLPAPGGPEELLKHRFLCRRGGLLLVGSTGLGKSTFAVQAMIHWALARPFLGIEPNEPLRSVMIQAENDEGDLAEMVEGVVLGLGLSANERALVGERVKVACESTRTAAGFVEQVLAPICKAEKPDLLWIDPVLAYIGGDSNSQADVGGFLRNGLNPILQEHNCGCVLIHHTNKPRKGGDKDDWKGGDSAYLGAGSAEWANWPRGVLAIQHAGSNKVFTIRAAKRGRRLKWRDEFDSPLFEKWIGHSADDSLRWEELSADHAQEILAAEAPQSTARKLTIDIVRSVMLPKKPTGKAQVVAGLKGQGFSRERAQSGLADLVEAGELFLIGRKRGGAKPEHCYWLLDTVPSGFVRLTATGGAEE